MNAPTSHILHFLLRGRWRTTDRRGAVRPLTRRENGPSPEEWAEITAAYNASQARWLGRIGILLSFCGVVLAIGIVASGQAWDAALPMKIFLFIIVLGATISLWRLGVQNTRTAFIGAMLKHERCPSCGSTLRGLPTFSDGCKVCPECDGAWKPPTSSTS